MIPRQLELDLTYIATKNKVVLLLGFPDESEMIPKQLGKAAEHGNFLFKHNKLHESKNTVFQILSIWEIHFQKN